MHILIFDLKKGQIFLDGRTMFENTDGCANQYDCATAIHLLSMLATEINITINRAVDAPGHRQNLVDGMNACDKQYLKQMMMIITLPVNYETPLEDKKTCPTVCKNASFSESWKKLGEYVLLTDTRVKKARKSQQKITSSCDEETHLSC